PFSASTRETAAERGTTRNPDATCQKAPPSPICPPPCLRPCRWSPRFFVAGTLSPSARCQAATLVEQDGQGCQDCQPGVDGHLGILDHLDRRPCTTHPLAGCRRVDRRSGRRSREPAQRCTSHTARRP